ncbi:DinB family protein [Paenibacillus sp. PR3]|uniref:DinB family protein n=1 Tax=Paenibacillus terricola TaxID=2763503 RepID=A0ABR8N1W2_9BACL|nr:DinB family protein [Paenibacillus terricola]MBD3922164.1 DinB family protein [Paenibacillus terricola]
MKSLLLYNWEVRDDYIRSFEELSIEELVKDRHAGQGSILKTLVHIIDVEYSWICAIMGKPEILFDVADYGDLPSIASLSNRLRAEIREDLNILNLSSLEQESIIPPWMTQPLSKAEILMHLIIHEIHHVGQLSLWARELGITPPNSNFIGRDFINKTRMTQ